MNTLMKRTNGYMPTTTFSGLVDKIFQNSLDSLFDDELLGFNNSSQNVSVPVNVKETDKSFELEVIAPGLKKEDFKINVNGSTLSVSFEHQQENNQQSKGDGWLRKEYQKRSFARTFSLDDTIDTSKISAKYSDGILHLSLLKKESAQNVSRIIEIK